MVFQRNEKSDTYYNLRMSTEDKARLKKFADESNMPISYLIRFAVNELHEKKINK